MMGGTMRSVSRKKSGATGTAVVILLATATAPGCGSDGGGVHSASSSSSSLGSSESGGSAAMSSGSSSTGGSTTAETTASTQATTSSTGSGETGADACQGFASDAGIGPGVQFVVHQQSGAPVFFGEMGTCHPQLNLELATPSGDAFEWLFSQSWQDANMGCELWECDALTSQTDCTQFCGGGECDPAQFGLIQADHEVSREWSGAMLLPMTMTMECAQGTGCDVGCWRRGQAPPGIYTATFTGYRSCEGACTCPDGRADQDECFLDDAESISDPFTVSVDFDYPDDTVVDIVIQ